jgi:hypothetical protein
LKAGAASCKGATHDAGLSRGRGRLLLLKVARALTGICLPLQQDGLESRPPSYEFFLGNALILVDAVRIYQHGIYLRTKLGML